MRSQRMGNVRESRRRDHIDTGFLRRCILALGVAFKEVKTYGESDVLHDLHRAACVKRFELVLEQSGTLLRKRLAAFFASNQRADALYFNDLFRHAAKHQLMDVEMAERWLVYRDCRNDSAHEHGEHFGDKVLDLLPDFIADAKLLADSIEVANDG